MTRADILIVEDEFLIALNLESLLNKFNYRVVGKVTSGTEAIIQAELLKPDLILMDIMLEGEMDGIEAADIIKSKFNIPVIYLTAYSTEEVIKRAKLTEPFGYLLKPIDDKELYITIETSLYKNKKNLILSHLTEANPNMLFLLDDKGNIEYANPAVYKFIKAHNLNISIVELLFPSDYKEILKKCFSEQSIYETETSWKDLNFLLKCNYIVNIGLFMLSFDDITEVKRLQLENELYHKAVDSSMNAIMITDTEGNFMFVNKAFEELYQYERADIKGVSTSILNASEATYVDNGMSEEYAREVVVNMWKDIRDPEKGKWEGLILNKRKDGQIIWTDFYINAIQNEKKEQVAFIGMPVDIGKKKEEELRIHLELYTAINDLAEKRDDDTGANLKRIGTYSKIISQYLKKTRKFVEDIEIFSKFHDIGKVGIPDNILLAPRKLTEEEFETMKTHTILGYEILQGKKILEVAADIARYHHEKWDGSGYPDRIAGEAIPVSARIVSVCDVYDALRSKRPYKDPWPHEKAINLIAENKGIMFDPQIVEIFLSIETEFDTIFNNFKN